MLILVLAAAGAFFGYANPYGHIPFLSLIFPAALAYAGIKAISPKHAFLNGFILATCAITACLYWIFVAVHVYGGIASPLAALAPVALAMILAFFYALFPLSLYYAAQGLPPWLLCFFAGLAWSFMEYATGWIFSGFPWMTLSASFSQWPFLIQGAAYIGAYALSGVFACLGIAALLSKKLAGPRVVALACLGFILAAGFTKPAPDSFTAAPVQVALVQGNIDQGQKWNRKYQVFTIDTYADLTRQAVEKDRPKLVIWPETAMPFYLQDTTSLSMRVRNLAGDNGLWLITGTPAYELRGEKDYVLFNRGYLIDPDGELAAKYDKEHLVPFGEYMPLKDILPFDKLVEGVGDFMPGHGQNPMQVGDLALGTLICYEGIFPELAQSRVEAGANVLVNISNDAWYGATSAPYQHLSLVTLRAVEQRRFIARATNTGISAIIDPAGRILKSGGLFKTQYVAGSVRPLSGTSVFHNLFHFIGIFIALAFAALLAASVFWAAKNKKSNQFNGTH